MSSFLTAMVTAKPGNMDKVCSDTDVALRAEASIKEDSDTDSQRNSLQNHLYFRAFFVNCHLP
jgi:hypothetical protein